MASRDIRSTVERVRELEAVIGQIRLAIRGFRDVEKFHKQMVRHGWNNYEDIHFNILNKHGDLDAILAQAYADLNAYRNSSGNIFQYVWQAGKNGISGFTLTTTTIVGKDESGSSMTTLFSDSDFNGGGAVSLVPQNHFIKIENAENAANNGIWQLSAAPTVGQLNFSGATLVANLLDSTMKITYWATS